MKLFTVLILSGFLLVKSAEAVQNQPEYLPGKIIIKFEGEQTLTQKARVLGIHPRTHVQDLMEGHGITRFQPVFGDGARGAVGRTLSKRNIQTSVDEVVDDLSRTFYIDYTAASDPKTLSLKLASMPGVVYAEPHFVYHLHNEPNDPLFGSQGQNYFEYQNFVDTWGITQSSTSVVIAIVDSGVFYDHPDLKNKLHRIPQPSPASEAFEDIADDSIGWNFWESGDVFAGEAPVQNNDPTARWSFHGTHVAGIAAAETDNEAGIAGTGYNASFMPVKAGGTEQYPSFVPFGMQGILYAAINEADIINASFGSSEYSEFGDDVVNTATELGSLIVASAGNNGNDSPGYPASLQNTLSVGSVDTPSGTPLGTEQDNISEFSSYGFDVDVFATGGNIRSTGFFYDPFDDTWIVEPDSLGYLFASGTSMSTPVVSGLAALVKHQHPDWSPQRIAYQIRNTARPIEDGRVREYKLGRGVIDAFSTVTANMPGLEITDIQFVNQEGNSLNIKEEGFAEITIINHGAAVTPSVSISSLTNNISTVTAAKNLGSIGTGQTTTFELGVAIEEGFELDETPIFALEYVDENRSYEDFSIQEYGSLLYENVETDALTMSFPNDGTIGFREPFERDGGVGFVTNNGENQLFDGGLMIHAVLDDTVYVPNQVRSQNFITRDFSPVRNITFQEPELADIEFSAHFNSSNHPVAEDLDVEMETFAFEGEDFNQTVFVRYTIINTSSKDYNDVHVGLFNDWDIGNNSTNFVEFSEPDSILYAYDGQNEDQPFVAVAHMGFITSAFAIDNTSEMTLHLAQTREDSLNFGTQYGFLNPQLDGFTRNEKEVALKSGFEQTTIVNTDISTVTGTGPFVLEEDGVITVGFIYAYGSNLDDLRDRIFKARELNLFPVSIPGTYRDGATIAVPEITRLYQNFPNPFGNSTTIQYDLAEQAHVELTIYNVLGQVVSTPIDEMVNEGRQTISFDTGGLASGVYLAVLRTGDNMQAIKMSLVK
ncbi:MAG: S8 family serine peptidase [Balneolales bacterium]